MKRTLEPGAQLLLICMVLVYGTYAMRRLEPGFTFAKYDPGWMITTVMSLVEDRDLDLRNQLKSDPREAADQTSQGTRGEWYPLHEYFMAVVTVPFYVVMGIVGCLVFNVAVMITLMMMVYVLCRRHVDEQTAFIAAAMTGFTTLFLDYTYSYSLDVFGAFVLVCAYLVTVKSNCFWGGFVWGLAILARAPNGVTMPAFLVYLWLDDGTRVKRVSFFLLGALPGLLLLGASNWMMFGSPFATAYSRWQHFQDGQALIASQGSAFSASLLERLPRVLFDQHSGLFLGAPLLLIAFFFGLRPFWCRARNEAILSVLISVSMIVLFSKYSLAVPGTPGNRYLMPVVALGAVPLSFAVCQAFVSRSKGLVNGLPQHREEVSQQDSGRRGGTGRP